MGLIRKKPRPVPLLTEKHRVARLQWCNENKDTDWTNVVFSDESQMQFFPNDVKELVKKGETPVRGKVKHPPSVMVWGGMSQRGTTPLALISGRVNSIKYQEILNDFLIER